MSQHSYKVCPKVDSSFSHVHILSQSCQPFIHLVQRVVNQASKKEALRRTKVETCHKQKASPQNGSKTNRMHAVADRYTTPLLYKLNCAFRVFRLRGNTNSVRGHVQMMSALGGGEGGTPKADKSTDKLRDCDKGGRRSKIPKHLQTSYKHAPLAYLQ